MESIGKVIADYFGVSVDKLFGRSAAEFTDIGAELARVFTLQANEYAE